MLHGVCTGVVHEEKSRSNERNHKRPSVTPRTGLRHQCPRALFSKFSSTVLIRPKGSKKPKGGEKLSPSHHHHTHTHPRTHAPTPHPTLTPYPHTLTPHLTPTHSMHTRIPRCSLPTISLEVSASRDVPRRWKEWSSTYHRHSLRQQLSIPAFSTFNRPHSRPGS